MCRSTAANIGPASWPIWDSMLSMDAASSFSYEPPAVTGNCRDLLRIKQSWILTGHSDSSFAYNGDLYR